MEALIAFKRAGADAILTYYALTAAAWAQGVNEARRTPDPLRLDCSPAATFKSDSDSRSSSLRRRTVCAAVAAKRHVEAHRSCGRARR